jgi:hypothetical protein
METIIVILVLFVLLVLFGGAGYFFVRETGWDNARLWITGPRQVRRMMSPNRDDTSNAGTPSLSGRYRDAHAADEQGSMHLALDDTALRNLREELQAELTRAAGLTRDFDARLTRMEADVSTSKQLPEEIGKSMQQTVHEVEIRTRKRISRIQGELRAARMADSPFGQRRAEALAELYSHLAQVEAALAAVVNPLLLPGEPLRVPDELFEDTLDWENWNDVGDRAYGFGDVFNRDRIVLEPALADQIERFIATFRQALTDTVSPVVQNPSRTTAQVAQMRQGLTTIIAALPPLRREIESAYREISAARPRDDDEDEFDA